MKTMEREQLDVSEEIPHRKGSKREGKGAKVSCPGNADGNGAHMYVVIKETLHLDGGHTYSYHHKVCIGCDKTGRMKGWKYSGDVYEERVYDQYGYSN